MTAKKIVKHSSQLIEQAQTMVFIVMLYYLERGRIKIAITSVLHLYNNTIKWRRETDSDKDLWAIYETRKIFKAKNNYRDNSFIFSLL